MVRIALTLRRTLTSWPRASDSSVVFCRLGRERRLVLLLAWLTLWPYCTPLPVMAQRRAMTRDPLCWNDLVSAPPGPRRSRRFVRQWGRAVKGLAAPPGRP